MNYSIKLCTGDPSNDGHGMTDVYYFRCNYSTDQIRQAYKEACIKTGLTFTTNNEFGFKWDHPEYKDRQICVEYEQCKVSELAEKILEENGINLEKYLQEEEFRWIDIDNLITLFLDFIKIILPDLEYKFYTSDAKLLNLAIGYGCYN